MNNGKSRYYLELLNYYDYTSIGSQKTFGNFFLFKLEDVYLDGLAEFGLEFVVPIEVWQHKEGLIADQFLLPFGAVESNFVQ